MTSPPIKRWRIHWAWLPAAIFMGAVGWIRYGAATAVLLILAGLALGVLVEWRARRREPNERPRP